MLITQSQVLFVVPTIKRDRASVIANLCNIYAPVYGIDTYDVFHEFFATLAHESGSFRSKEENLNYTAPRILAVWPSRFKKLSEAVPFARNPRALANKVYGGRMGNVKPDDGWTMRGSGYMMATGRSIAESYLRYKNMAHMNAERIMELVRKDDSYAMDMACWIFAVEKKLIPLAKGNGIVRVTDRINGGRIGLTDRIEFYNRCVKIMR